MPSHVIRAWRYDASARTLAITFLNGRRYEYDNVPADVAEDMRAAFAKGSFFNRRIRGRYPERRLDSPPADSAIGSSSS